jgi:hypothetical protein
MSYYWANIYSSFKLIGSKNIWIKEFQCGREPEASPGLELGTSSLPLISTNLSLITHAGLGSNLELEKTVSDRKLIETNLAFYQDVIRVEKDQYIEVKCYGCKYKYSYQEFKALNLDHIEIKYCDRKEYFEKLEISYINLARKYYEL